jgi:hypothetical protein
MSALEISIATGTWPFLKFNIYQFLSTTSNRGLTSQKKKNLEKEELEKTRHREHADKQSVC